MQLLVVFFILVCVNGAHSYARSSSSASKVLHSSSLALKMSEGGGESAPLVDFSGAASGVLGSYRVPAMLLVGGAYGGVFALPLNSADSIVMQLAKRSYIIVGLLTVVCELLSVVCATMAMDKLALLPKSKVILAPDLKGFLVANSEMEFVTCRLTFLGGLIGFGVMCGMRAWISLSCPPFGKLSIAVITSGIAFMLAAISENLSFENKGIPSLLRSYFAVLWKKLKVAKVSYVLATLIALASMGYGVYSYIHVWQYLTKGGCID